MACGIGTAELARRFLSPGDRPGEASLLFVEEQNMTERCLFVLRLAKVLSASGLMAVSIIVCCWYIIIVEIFRRGEEEQSNIVIVAESEGAL